MKQEAGVSGGPGASTSWGVVLVELPRHHLCSLCTTLPAALTVSLLLVCIGLSLNGWDPTAIQATLHLARASHAAAGGPQTPGGSPYPPPLLSPSPPGATEGGTAQPPPRQSESPTEAKGGAAREYGQTPTPSHRDHPGPPVTGWGAAVPSTLPSPAVDGGGGHVGGGGGVGGVAEGEGEVVGVGGEGEGVGGGEGDFAARGAGDKGSEGEPAGGRGAGLSLGGEGLDWGGGGGAESEEGLALVVKRLEELKAALQKGIVEEERDIRGGSPGGGGGGSLGVGEGGAGAEEAVWAPMATLDWLPRGWIQSMVNDSVLFPGDWTEQQLKLVAVKLLRGSRVHAAGMGGSNTRGWQIGRINAWPNVLQWMLNTFLPSPAGAHEVVNNGAPATTPRVYVHFVPALMRPPIDWVITEFNVQAATGRKDAHDFVSAIVGHPKQPAVLNVNVFKCRTPISKGSKELKDLCVNDVIKAYTDVTTEIRDAGCATISAAHAYGKFWCVDKALQAGQCAASAPDYSPPRRHCNISLIPMTAGDHRHASPMAQRLLASLIFRYFTNIIFSITAAEIPSLVEKQKAWDATKQRMADEELARGLCMTTAWGLMYNMGCSPLVPLGPPQGWALTRLRDDKFVFESSTPGSSLKFSVNVTEWTSITILLLETPEAGVASFVRADGQSVRVVVGPGPDGLRTMQQQSFKPRLRPGVSVLTVFHVSGVFRLIGFVGEPSFSQSQVDQYRLDMEAWEPSNGWLDPELPRLHEMGVQQLRDKVANASMCWATGWRDLLGLGCRTLQPAEQGGKWDVVEVPEGRGGSGGGVVYESREAGSFLVFRVEALLRASVGLLYLHSGDACRMSLAFRSGSPGSHMRLGPSPSGNLTVQMWPLNTRLGPGPSDLKVTVNEGVVQIVGLVLTWL